MKGRVFYNTEGIAFSINESQTLSYQEGWADSNTKSKTLA
jgi:hypothetical protein